MYVTCTWFITTVVSGRESNIERWPILVLSAAKQALLFLPTTILYQCLQLVRIRPYLYGIYVHCTDVRKLRSIIRKSCARSRSNPPVHRCTLGLGKETTRDLSRVVSVQQRTLVLVVMVCRNLQMRATRVSLRSSSYAVLLYCLFLEIPF